MKIRDAIPEDAAAACQTMRRSIAELCAADHRNDPLILERWLSNKSPETFRSWIKPGNSLMIVIDDDNILAIGCVTDAGEITLNYVRPTPDFAESARRCWAHSNIVPSNDVTRKVPKQHGVSISPEDIPKTGPEMANSARRPATACQNGCHFPSMTLTPSHTAPTNPVTMTVITALKV